MTNVKISQIFKIGEVESTDSVNYLSVQTTQNKIFCGGGDFVLVEAFEGYVLYSIVSKNNKDGLVDLKMKKVREVQ